MLIGDVVSVFFPNGECSDPRGTGTSTCSDCACTKTGPRYRCSTSEAVFDAELVER